jgi:hypothetical protein
MNLVLGCVFGFCLARIINIVSKNILYYNFHKFTGENHDKRTGKIINLKSSQVRNHDKGTGKFKKARKKDY